LSGLSKNVNGKNVLKRERERGKFFARGNEEKSTMGQAASPDAFGGFCYLSLILFLLCLVLLNCGK